ncbi:MAG: enoyl-CoA hydratase/isomerase family protein [Deltaproteobacteria bacterium]|nr:enoyl-CoA hydratase/isomerase family protein [Deltaproteobacteria bacterium]MCK5709696.1 enoyl-CoA hydratase/isomerase family protein [Deltaproteobacteria bacterium]
MSLINVKSGEKIATITLNRPKVNALNEPLIDELRAAFDNIENDNDINAVILRGKGSFFSFGFDVPEFMSYPKDSFERYVFSYSDLIKKIFMFPKPVIAALNGHAVAGGCILALGCDYRIMVTGKAKISLNEMTFGSTLFSCVIETLRYAVGSKKSEHIIYSGKMFSAEEALSLGLVDKSASEEDFISIVEETAQDYSRRDMPAFNSIKKLLKMETLKKIEEEEKDTVSQFVDIWYSESMRENLKNIEIRG